MSPESELAWAGGLFDGEGWVGAIVSRGGGRALRSRVDQTDPRVLERFTRAIGVGKVLGPYGPYGKNQGKAVPCWTVTLNASDTRVLVERLWDYVSPVKRQQMLKALAGWLLFRKRRRL